MKTTEAKAYLNKVISGHYMVDRLIGEGSFAWVYHAVSRHVGQEVAIKVLHSTEPTAAMRFAREISVLKALPKNANVVGLIDHGQTHDGRPFQVIEYVDGITLKDGIRLCKSLMPRQAVSFMIELCQAFVELHQLGVAHRDVKPENILLARQGGIKLIDFGLIRDAQGILQLLEQEDPLDTRRLFSQELDRWTVAGTPEYMAPEQFSDARMDDLAKARTDTWSDVFSLGVIFYQLLSGKKPFPMRPVTNKGYHREILRYMRWRMSLSDDDYPPCPGIDKGLDSVLRKTLRQDPRQRQPEARALMRDLVRYKKTGAGVPEIDDEHTQMLHVGIERLGVFEKGRTLDISSPVRRAPTGRVEVGSDEVTQLPPPPPPPPPPRSASEASTLETPHEGERYYDVGEFEDEETHLDSNPEVDAIVAEARAAKGSTEFFFSSLTSLETKGEIPAPRTTQDLRARDGEVGAASGSGPSPIRTLPSTERDGTTEKRDVPSEPLGVLTQSPEIVGITDSTTERHPTNEGIDDALPTPLMSDVQDTTAKRSLEEALEKSGALEHESSFDLAEPEGSELDESGSLDISIEANDSVIITEDLQLELEEYADDVPEAPLEPEIAQEPGLGFRVPEPPRAPIRRPNLPPWVDEPDWDEHAPTHVQNPHDVDRVVDMARKKQKK